MIYSFTPGSDALKAFIDEVNRSSLDFEINERDATVVRVFGQVDAALRARLDTIAGKPGRLTLARGGETVYSRLFLGPSPVIIAGPCSVESEEQLEAVASFLERLGIGIMRGGAFKPRTSSSSFQGLGRRGLKILSEVAGRHNLKIITEVMDKSQLDDVVAVADVLQVGSRNMFNYPLLTALGSIDKPVLLKRGMAATIDEWVQAGEYIRKGGNEQIILCERGIRTFEPRTRFTLDILAVPIARKLTGLPVIVDVSHPAGDRELVPPLMRAALAAGADGIMAEVHPDPETALSDGRQSMTFDAFEALYTEISGYTVAREISHRK